MSEDQINMLNSYYQKYAEVAEEFQTPFEPGKPLWENLGLGEDEIDNAGNAFKELKNYYNKYGKKLVLSLLT